MLQATNLTLWRGDLCLFDDLCLSVEAGQALLLKGPNGSGKTTLLRVLCGLTQPDAGEVLWHGEPATSRMRGEVAYCGHQPALKADLSLRQNIEFFRRLTPSPPALADLLLQISLDRCADIEVRHLSAGQKRRAALARVLMSRAPLWMLDEPFANIDQAGRDLIGSLVTRHLERGGLAVIVVHGEAPLPVGRTSTLSLGEA